VFAGAVGLNKAAISGPQPPSSSTWRWSSSREGRRIRITSSRGWLAVGGASVLGAGSGFAPTHPAPRMGHARSDGSAGAAALLELSRGQFLVAVHRDRSLSGCWWPSGPVTSMAQGGHSQTTTSALGYCLVGPTWASTSALVGVGLPHSGQGRGTERGAVTVAHRLARHSGGPAA